ncbi:rap/ran-GAP domain-containing protein [Phthorimaea operculella]|nr:rap/ran-GAP domain-containing protein [Phthorimaea operculella]
MTYNSDPGSRSETDDSVSTGEKSHHQLQKTASDTVVGADKPPPGARGGSYLTPSMPPRDDLPPLARSKRSNTISVMSPARKHRPVYHIQHEQSENSSLSSSSNMGGAGVGGVARGGAGGAGLTPAFVFLQLYHNMSTYPMTPPVPGAAPALLHPLAERPLKVSGAQHERTIKNLDLVPPLETYKVGVLYVGPGQQDDEVAILSNEYGSVRYAEFLSALGTVVSLEGGADDAARPDLFLNLEMGGKDGRYTYVWSDDVTQVQFHVATAMPRAPTDPQCNEKRKYIGNDFVSIVYNDSGQDFNIHTIKAHRYVWSDDVTQVQFHVATAMPRAPTDPQCNEKRKYIGNDFVSIVYNDSGHDFNIHTIKVKQFKYTHVWCDDVTQVQFHVATAMPRAPTDPQCNEKRKYIGNDFVSIVYNDSGHDFNIHTIKAHRYVWSDDVTQVQFHVATAMPRAPTDPQCNEKRKYIGNDFVSIVYNDSGHDFNIHTIKAHRYVWSDDVTQVQFHVATAMPRAPTDPQCNEKRKYIGNDFVSIVYNDSGHDFNIHTIKAHRYVWSDDVTQVQFHVATAMPRAPTDPQCNEKRKYIGNDFVSIVYNDSGHDFNIHTIKAHRYVWSDDVTQVQFHVATAMPRAPTDPQCNEKRKYIGNDFVSIVYNDSGHDFNIHTIKFHVATAMPRAPTDPQCNEKRKYIGNDFVSIVYNDSGHDFNIHTIKFHVATAMPRAPTDPQCNEKRKYIGNDFVSIVYNDSGQDFNIHTIKFHVATAMPRAPTDPQCNEKRKYIGNDFVSIVYNDSGHDFNIHTIKFHVATAMPRAPTDPQCNEKRKYIGNDFVSIVYNDSGQDFNIHTIKYTIKARCRLHRYVWSDDVTQVQFHVATAMPRAPTDPQCNEKRKYIGNDFVSIVYNDSGHDFNIHTIKAHRYVWSDDVTQVQFHVATAMPRAPTDPQCNEKRKYIGNDFVSIVYNDSGHDFNIHTIKAHRYVVCDDVTQVQFHVATAMPRAPTDPQCNEKRKYIGNDFVSIVYNDSGHDFNIHTIKVTECEICKSYLYTYVWSDDVTQVQFHVATAMPRAPTDPQCNEKRKYIGNDFVSIVYNDSGQDFNIHTIKGQLNFCIVVVEPSEHGLSRVLVKTKDEKIRTKFLSHVETHIVSDANVALLARQTALHCCLASHISQSLKLGGAPYASNALERLRLMKRLRRRAEAERLAAAARAPAPYAAATDLHQRVAIDDFNDYT